MAIFFIKSNYVSQKNVEGGVDGDGSLCCQ